MELGLSPSSLAHWPLSRTQAHLPVPQGLQDGHVLNDHYTGTCVSDATLGGLASGEETEFQMVCTMILTKDSVLHLMP